MPPPSSDPVRLGARYLQLPRVSCLSFLWNAIFLRYSCGTECVLSTLLMLVVLPLQGTPSFLAIFEI